MLKYCVHVCMYHLKIFWDLVFCLSDWLKRISDFQVNQHYESDSVFITHFLKP